VCARKRADLGVTFLGKIAELRHVTEHEPFFAVELREHLDACAHRARIRVIGVVNEPGAAQRALELQASRHRAHDGEARDNVLESRTGSGRRGRWRRARS